MSDAPDKKDEKAAEAKGQQKTDPHLDRYKNNQIEFDTNRGPTDNRGCTDIFFCLFFLVFIAGMVIVAGLGFSEGKPETVFTPFDEDGRNCGVNATENYTFLYLYSVVSNVKTLNTSKVLSNSVCVKSCPKNYTGFLECYPTTLNRLCQISEENFYSSTEFLGRYCVPDGGKVYNLVNGTATLLSNPTINNQTNSLINVNFLNTDKLISWITDLQNCWPILLASVGWAFVIAFVYLLLVRWCAGVIAYTTILLVLCALAGLGYLFQARISYYTDLGDTQYELAMKVLCGLCYSLAGIWLLMILFMCNRIRLAIALTEVTAEYVGSVCSVYLVPIFFYIITVLFYAYWVALSVFLYSSGTISKTNNSLIASVEWNTTTRYAWWYHLFSLFYINAFLNALNQFVLASSACIWYFNQGKDGVDSKGEVSTSFYRAFRYHLGSLAFGSLIVAIIQFIIAILEYLKKKTEVAGPQKSKIYKCMITCCQCCLNCIAKCVEFINRHAYIQIALTGHNFCRSAFDGFSIVIRNLGRWSMLFLIGGSFNFIGKLFISSGTGIIGYLLITRVEQFNTKLNSPILPTAVMVLVGWIIGSLIMNIYGMSGDAMLHSFLLDEEKNGGVAKSKCPENLRTFMSEERSE